MGQWVHVPDGHTILVTPCPQPINTSSQEENTNIIRGEE